MLDDDLLDPISDVTHSVLILSGLLEIVYAPSALALSAMAGGALPGSP